MQARKVLFCADQRFYTSLFRIAIAIPVVLAAAVLAYWLGAILVSLVLLTATLGRDLLSLAFWEPNIFVSAASSAALMFWFDKAQPFFVKYLKQSWQLCITPLIMYFSGDEMKLRRGGIYDSLHGVLLLLGAPSLL